MCKYNSMLCIFLIENRKPYRWIGRDSYLWADIILFRFHKLFFIIFCFVSFLCFFLLSSCCLLGISIVSFQLGFWLFFSFSFLVFRLIKTLVRAYVSVYLCTFPTCWAAKSYSVFFSSLYFSNHEFMLHMFQRSDDSRVSDCSNNSVRQLIEESQKKQMEKEAEYLARLAEMERLLKEKEEHERQVYAFF